MEVKPDKNIGNGRERCEISSTNDVNKTGDPPYDTEIYDRMEVYYPNTSRPITPEPSNSSSELSEYRVWRPINREACNDGPAQARNDRDWEYTLRDVPIVKLPRRQSEDRPNSRLCIFFHPIGDRLSGSARASYICCSQTQLSGDFNPDLGWKQSKSSRCRFRFMTEDFQQEQGLGGCNLEIMASCGMVREGFAKQYMMFDRSQSFDKYRLPAPTVLINNEECYMDPVGIVSAYLEHDESSVRFNAHLLVVSDEEFKPCMADCVLSNVSIAELHLRCTNLICFTRFMHTARPVKSS